MDVERLTLQNMNSKNVTMFTYTHHIQIFKGILSNDKPAQSVGCGQARGVKPKNS